MTTLQIILLIAGTLLVLGVLAYNFYQERELQRHYAERLVAGNPIAAEPPVPSEPADPHLTQREEPRQVLPCDGPDFMAETVLVLSLPPDCHVSPEQAREFLALPGKRVRVLWQARGMGNWILLNDPATIVAYLNEVPAATATSEHQLSTSPANELAFCLQLADRSNVTTVEQLDAFQKHVHSIATLLFASYTPFDASVEAERAHALDKVCAQLDLQIALTLNGKVGPMPNPQFYLAAKKQGFALERGALRYRHNGAELFRIESSNGEPLSEDRLNNKAIQNPVALLDIPQVSNPALAFDELLRQVTRLTQAVSAQLMDDRMKPITEQGLNLLRSEVEKATAAMRNTGIEPGSPRALRLFAS